LSDFATDLPCVDWLVFLLVVISLLVDWLAHGHIDVVRAWLLSLLGDQSVGVSTRASEDCILCGDMACVARQVVFVVLDKGFRRHFELIN